MVCDSNGKPADAVRHFEMAYRLLRIYERAAQFEKLHRLGLRIASYERPFDRRPYSSSSNGNGWSERANAELAITIQHADTDVKRQELKAALMEGTWLAARTIAATNERSRRPAAGSGRSVVRIT